MKAVASREGLLTAVQVAMSVAPLRSPKAILQNIKLDLTENQATLMATDLEQGIRYRVSGLTIEQAGVAILPAQSVAQILRELPDETITLESTAQGVRLSGASSRFDLLTGDPLDFPEIPDFGVDAPHKLKAGTLATMIRRTLFAIAPENSRYALHSVLMEVDDSGEARLVATDGKRLALMPGTVTSVGVRREGDSLLAPKSLALLQKVLLDPEEEVEVGLHLNEALFRTSKVTVYSRLVEGRFPRYQEVFPAEAKITIPIGVGPFFSALRQARIVTTDESRGVDFTFGEGELVLSTRGAESGQSEVRMPIAHQGATLQVTFDPVLLIDALKVLEPEEEVVLHFADARKAVVLRTEDRFAYIVMPLAREGP